MYLTIGDLVVYQTHPYVGNYHKIKISAYSDYTTPVMIVCKKTDNKKFDLEAGKEGGEYIECLYYNSREGKFLKKGFNSKDLVKITEEPNLRKKYLKEVNVKKLLETKRKVINGKNIDILIKEEFLHKKVSLKSVDLELHKVKINKEKENGDLVETNHLEFLPPVMTIIGHRIIDDKNKFCDKSGIPLLELKCKWYNSQSKSFSEEFIKLEALYEIDLNLSNGKRNLLNDYQESIESNDYNLVSIDKPIILEGSELQVKFLPIQVEDIIYKHYFYEALISNLFSNKKELMLLTNSISMIPNNILWGNEYPSYNKKYIGVNECIFQNDEYYQISYSDKLKRNTKRVVKVIETFFIVKDLIEFVDELNDDDRILWFDIELFNDLLEENNIFYFRRSTFETNYLDVYSHNGEMLLAFKKTLLGSKNIEVFLQTNCLLREGKVRHFKKDGIYEIKEIKNGKELFEEGLLIGIE